MRPVKAARWVVGLQPVAGMVFSRSVGGFDADGEGEGVADGLVPLSPAGQFDCKLVSLLCAFRSMVWPVNPPTSPASTAVPTP